MVASSVLGFPRIGEIQTPDRAYSLSLKPFFPSGANREVKKAVEAYWAGKLSADELTKAALDVKKYNWSKLKEQGVDFIPRFVHRSPRVMRSPY